MVFDPMKFYDDGQRKQKRYDSLVPVFVVALVMLVGFYAFFVVYQRSHKVAATSRPNWTNDHACYRETLDADWKPVYTGIVCPEDMSLDEKGKP